MKRGMPDTQSCEVGIEYIDSETLTVDNIRQLEQVDAILVPGGFGSRGVEGKLLAVGCAYSKNSLSGYPFGMLAVVEFVVTVPVW